MADKKLHILLLRLSSLGDVIISTAAIQLLKKSYGSNIKISFLTWDNFSPALAGLDVVQLSYSKKSAKADSKAFYSFLHEQHRQDPFDFIWDLQASVWSFKIRFSFLDIPTVCIDKRKWERTLLLLTRMNFYKKSLDGSRKLHHAENLWRDFAAVFNSELTTDQDLFPFVSSSNIKKRILFLPSAAHPLKKWPLDYFSKLMELLDAQLPSDIEFFCLSGPGEEESAVLHSKFTSNCQRAYQFSNNLTLSESLDLVKTMQIVISNDTGLMHQAWVHGVKVIGLFGPTVADYGFAPFGKNVKILSQDLICQPCSVTGSGSCWRFGSHLCMKNILPEVVAKTALQLLDS